MKKYFFATAALLSCFLWSYTATANLLIYPVRVSFDQEERTAELTLTNTSSTTNTYRLGWKENFALPEGGYRELSEIEAESSPIASPMLRFAPRQVTLKPGERQLIKVSLRRPRDLADGEYRSHLLFKSLPPSPEKTETQGTSMRINMVMSFAVPVSVQQGDYDAEVKLSDAEIIYNPTTSKGSVKVTLKRSGIHSTSGNIEALWTPKGGEQRMIAKLSDYNVWAELDEAKPSLIWAEEEFTPSDGTLRIRYEGGRDFSGNNYIDETIEVKKEDIRLISQ